MVTTIELENVLWICWIIGFSAGLLFSAIVLEKGFKEGRQGKRLSSFHFLLFPSLPSAVVGAISQSFLCHLRKLRRRQLKIFVIFISLVLIVRKMATIRLITGAFYGLATLPEYYRLLMA